MSEARAVILARVRTATADVPPGEVPAWQAPEREATPSLVGAARLARFRERALDYGVGVTAVGAEQELPAALGSLFARHQAGRVVVPADLPPSWRPSGVELIADDPPIRSEFLAEADGALTGCVLAIAETGTVVLDGGAAQGRRLLTLLPDLHVCVVRAEQIVADLPDAFERLVAARPTTFVSGPSATADIEFQRVEGVHGPRRLEIVLQAPTAALS